MPSTCFTVESSPAGNTQLMWKQGHRKQAPFNMWPLLSAWFWLFQVYGAPMAFTEIAMSWRAESHRGMLLVVLWHPFELGNRREQELWTVRQGVRVRWLVLYSAALAAEVHLHPGISSLSSGSSTLFGLMYCSSNASDDSLKAAASIRKCIYIFFFSVLIGIAMKRM